MSAALIWYNGPICKTTIGRHLEVSKYYER